MDGTTADASAAESRESEDPRGTMEIKGFLAILFSGITGSANKTLGLGSDGLELSGLEGFGISGVGFNGFGVSEFGSRPSHTAL